MIEHITSFLRKRIAFSMRDKSAAIHITPPSTCVNLGEWQDDFAAAETMASLQNSSANPNSPIQTLNQNHSGGHS
jgi:hypothetical protein